MNPENGTIKFNYPDTDPMDLHEPCALRLAVQWATLETVGQRLNLTRERVRQIEVRALLQLKRSSPR